MEEVVALPPDELDGREVGLEHDTLEALEIVVQPGQSVGAPRGDDQVPGPGEGARRRDRPVELLPGPAERLQHGTELGRPGHVPRCHGGECRLHQALPSPYVHPHLPRTGREAVRALPVQLPQQHARCDRGVAAERDLGLGAVIADGAREPARRREERGLRVPHLGRDGLHLRGARQRVPDPDPGGVPTLGRGRECRQAVRRVRCHWQGLVECRSRPTPVGAIILHVAKLAGMMPRARPRVQPRAGARIGEACLRGVAPGRKFALPKRFPHFPGAS